MLDVIGLERINKMWAKPFEGDVAVLITKSSTQMALSICKSNAPGLVKRRSDWRMRRLVGVYGYDTDIKWVMEDIGDFIGELQGKLTPC